MNLRVEDLELFYLFLEGISKGKSIQDGVQHTGLGEQTLKKTLQIVNRGRELYHSSEHQLTAPQAIMQAMQESKETGFTIIEVCVLVGFVISMNEKNNFKEKVANMLANRLTDEDE